MTTSRALALVVLFSLSMGAHGQAMPKDLPWAVAALSGTGEWAIRLPQLLVRGWELLPPHRLTEAEAQALRQRFLDDSVRTFDQQASRLLLDLDRKRLMGPLPSTEPAATQKLVADLQAKRQLALDGTMVAQAPEKLAFRAVWSPGKDSLPWPASARSDLLLKTKALYLVNGTLREVGEYLSVTLELYSAIEERVLVHWEAQFAAEEAPDRIAEASDRFRSALFGRPWAGLSVTSPVPGAKIRLAGVWHSLPWSSDELEPGEVRLDVQSPGRSPETHTLVLVAEERQSLDLTDGEESKNPIVLDTEPSGVALYLDSRYLGLSPQTVDRPLSISRVRAQDDAWKTAAWEIGPQTVSPSVYRLVPPAPRPSIPQAKDSFYASLAVFSVSLTSSAFLGAWMDEQVRLVNAYANAGAVDGYWKAREKYDLVSTGYGVAVVLTSGVFVWMMFELVDYLGAAEASLP